MVDKIKNSRLLDMLVILASIFIFYSCYPVYSITNYKTEKYLKLGRYNLNYSFRTVRDVIDLSSYLGALFVISGPSGVGKGTVLSGALEELDKTILSISATTRAPREGEVNGVDYFFLSKEEFEEKIRNNEFLEWAEYGGNYYGTLKPFVINNLSKDNNVILEIDVQGAFQVENNCFGVISIFIAPPSLEELERRLRERGTESEEEIETRLQRAEEEMAYMDEYDYVVVNDDLDEAIEELIEIINGG